MSFSLLSDQFWLKHRHLSLTSKTYSRLPRHGASAISVIQKLFRRWWSFTNCYQGWSLVQGASLSKLHNSRCLPTSSFWQHRTKTLRLVFLSRCSAISSLILKSRLHNRFVRRLWKALLADLEPAFESFRSYGVLIILVCWWFCECWRLDRYRFWVSLLLIWLSESSILPRLPFLLLD